MIPTPLPERYRNATGPIPGMKGKEGKGKEVLLPQLFLLKRCRLRRFAPQLPTKLLPNKRCGSELTQVRNVTTDRARTR